MTQPLPAPARKKSRAARAFRLLMAVLAFGFVGYTLFDLGRRFDATKLEVHAGWAALSLVPLIAGVVIQAWGWTLLVERMAGARVHRAPAIALHVESMFARYVPGKVGLPLVRMAGAAAIGVKPATAGVSVFVEMLSFAAVGGAVGFALLSAGAQHIDLPYVSVGFVTLLVAFAAIVAVLIGVDRRRFPRSWLVRIGLGGDGPIVPKVVPLVHVLLWATWAAHGYCITRAVGGDGTAAFATSGYYVIAIIVGFMALVAPAGAGVREAILSAGLSPLVGPTGALAAALVSRIATIVAEVSGWLATRPLRARATTPRA